ncbi:hypothetical protein PSYPI_18771 [Pseudomonas syringae pv. pisi str. 1704B]|uniref:Uncharacterized protein n=1 Tax=Pseudomonas syringae pv. pisi str. 1704B TaxID=629263 RepID=F3GB63_PSESJ|nr:hypothetical protein PSYPI_18771 [Pseudomonas syringae pv. pisi str. 1704B]
MLGNYMNIPTMMTMFLKTGNLFNTTTNVSTESALSLIYYDNAAIWQVVP